MKILFLLPLLFSFSMIGSYPKLIVGDSVLVKKANSVLREIRNLNTPIPNFYKITLTFEYVNAEYLNDKKDLRAGYTINYNTDSPSIIINRIVWNGMSEDRRYLLIAHEMGHAIWRRSHTKDELNDNTKKSIMAPTLVPTIDFMKRKAYYLLEMTSICCEI